jgi:hypothetical protein
MNATAVGVHAFDVELTSATLEPGLDAGGRPSGYATRAAMPAQPQNPASLNFAACLSRQALMTWETMEFSQAAPLLHAIAMAEASDESLDLPSTAADFEISESVLRQQVEQIEDLGLALAGLEEGLHPIS